MDYTIGWAAPFNIRNVDEDVRCRQRSLQNSTCSNAGNADADKPSPGRALQLQPSHVPAPRPPRRMVRTPVTLEQRLAGIPKGARQAPAKPDAHIHVDPNLVNGPNGRHGRRPWSIFHLCHGAEIVHSWDARLLYGRYRALRS